MRLALMPAARKASRPAVAYVSRNRGRLAPPMAIGTLSLAAARIFIYIYIVDK